jgi:protein-disulfide isomerase
MSQNRREQLRKAEQAKANQQRLTRIIGVGAGLLVVVIVAVFAVVLISGANKAATTTPAADQVTPPHALADNLGIRPYPNATPQAGAPVVDLFFDYQCPICNQFESIYGAALEKLASSGQIDLHYRPMIFLDVNLQNDSSLRAGIAAACADTVDKYREYHDQVFANQPEQEGAGYADPLLRDTIPTKLGLTGDALAGFQKCYDGKSTHNWVQAQEDAGAKAGVTGTPTFRVNGHDVDIKEFANVAPEQLDTLIKKFS